MYAVVYKNRVIVGPMDWNRAIFQGSLEKEGVNNTLPRVAPEELPYVVNEDAKIMAVEEVRPAMNPMVEYYYGPIWDVSGNKAVASYEVKDSPIEAARVNFKTQAADERWKKEVSGTKLNINGTEVTLDTTREGRSAYTLQHAAMSTGSTVNWKFAEGWLNLTKSNMSSIVSSVNQHVQVAFDWEKGINEQIDAATTKEQLVAIQIIEPKEQPAP